MMKAVSSVLLLALSAGLLLSGCGQTGPLYLPGEAPESQTEGPFGLNEDQNEEQSSTPDAPAAEENAETPQ
jgi:predicted small lipoprotein YifL